MTVFGLFLRWLMGPPMATLVEDLHVRLLSDWAIQPDGSFIHPRCDWTIAPGHPCEGVYEGPNFYDRYVREIDRTYPEWFVVTNEIIGSRIGGIVVGEYQFRQDTKGVWYKAPFTHFYRIHQGKIVGIRYYMGEVSIDLNQAQPPLDLSALLTFRMPN